MTEQRNFYFYAHYTFENWDYTNPTILGIGGSEVSQIEMSSRLAQRHHTVVSYAPVPWNDEYKIHRNVTWKHYEKATFTEPGIWVIYRCPDVLDKFSIKHDNQEVWFIAQDTFYLSMSEELASRIDKYVCLCEDHAKYTAAKYPYVASKIIISSNGINIQLINEIEKLNLPRNPTRLMYSSSPDRGLEQLIPIFKRAKEFIPTLELHIFYGFENMDKVIEKMPWVAKIKDSIMQGVNSADGVFWHGRVGQLELTAEWFKSGIWCYPINFTETSCISCMEAQACGVIPITSPKWALRENVNHGILIDGDASDKLVQARFVGELIRVCTSTEMQNILRKHMIIEAKVRFNWERFVDTWESWIYAPECKFFCTQYAFQHKYAEGNILNVGCDSDASDFGSMENVVNLDVVQNEKKNVDIIMDIRRLLPNRLWGCYDTVILGDIIEHMTHDDSVIILKNARVALKNSGKIIITCPSDPRSKELQRIDNPTLPDDAAYPGGVSQYHRYISNEELGSMIHKAELKVDLVQFIDYTHFQGYGILCSIA